MTEIESLRAALAKAEAERDAAESRKSEAFQRLQRQRNDASARAEEWKRKATDGLEALSDAIAERAAARAEVEALRKALQRVRVHVKATMQNPAATENVLAWSIDDLAMIDDALATPPAPTQSTLASSQQEEVVPSDPDNVLRSIDHKIAVDTQYEVRRQVEDRLTILVNKVIDEVVEEQLGGARDKIRLHVATVMDGVVNNVLGSVTASIRERLAREFRVEIAAKVTG